MNHSGLTMQQEQQKSKPDKSNAGCNTLAQPGDEVNMLTQLKRKYVPARTKPQ